jgi:hypothetical protein
VTTNYRRSILREREVEMIHRGVQYERAVRIYYRKNNGSWPTSIEQLENTNKIRYLRKRYKDPMSPDGQWQIAHITDIKITGFTLVGAAGTAGAAQAAGGAGLAGAAGSSALAAATALQANSSNLNSTASGTAQGTDSSNTGTGTSTTSGQTTGTTGNGPADTNGTSGNGAGPVLGGGPMLGVISKSKAEGIHSFNDKSHYNEWYFIYDPSQDKGQQPKGPYNPNLTIGTTPTSNGTTGGQTGSPGSSNPGMPSPITPTTTIPGNNLAPTGPGTWGIPTATP